MPATTSQLFDFFDEHRSLTLERHEIASAAFTDLRYSVRSIIMSLAQSDDYDAIEVSRRLRVILSEWLTIPSPFDDAMLRDLTEMGGPGEVEARWGRDIRNSYADACDSATVLLAIENPVRPKLADLILDLYTSGRTYYIFCDRRARCHFESLPSKYVCPTLNEGDFIHSVAQYRGVGLFDCLIKMGPLRSRGWGAAPDAIVTAPRFDTLIQVVWSGCETEPGFGYDPVSALSTDTGEVGSGSGLPDHRAFGTKLQWKVQKTQLRDDTVGRRSVADIDEFTMFTQLAKPLDTQAATLVQVDEAHGILYPQHSRVLGLDPETGDIQFRLPGESLVEGMFLIIPVIDDTRLVGLQAEDGHFSSIWKEKLACEYTLDPSGIIARLRDADLKLVDIRSCIDRWCTPATTVIHAPQTIRHFEILIRVLGIDYDHSTQHLAQRAAWWQYAWDEIRRSRGEAIQSGVQEQQNAEDDLLSALRIMSSEIRAYLDRPAFVLPIPNTISVTGVFRFYRVLAVEEGFQVPRSEMRTLCSLERIDEWRV